MFACTFLKPQVDNLLLNISNGKIIDLSVNILDISETCLANEDLSINLGSINNPFNRLYTDDISLNNINNISMINLNGRGPLAIAILNNSLNA
jgi:hypothetical protein